MSKKKLIEGDFFSNMTNSNPVPSSLGTPTADPSTQEATRTTAVESKKSTENGLSEGFTRATIIIEKSILEKCRDIAYWDRVRDQDVYTEALNAYVNQYEKRIGRLIDTRPVTARRSVTKKASKSK
jgi:hypothetical protein